MTPPSRPATGVRLHIVTGKGGTGKTTVAGALALALASGGKKVLLCEVEGRQGIASLFDVAPLPYGERRIAVGSDGGEVYALAIDPEDALMEYLDMFYRLGRAGKALDRFGVIDFATTVAPGMRDVLLIGKVYEATHRTETSRRTKGRPTYDAVVLDAPPTGRIGRFLNVNTEVAGIAKVGPIRNQAVSIMRLLQSPATLVHLVASLEEMPVQEALDGVYELDRIGLPVGAIIVNQLRESELMSDQLEAAGAGRLDEGEIESALKEAGISADDNVLAGLLDEARQHAERVTLERHQRARVEGSDHRVLELPYLNDGIDLGALYELAETICSSDVI
ncbi:MAG: ArsA-related P-loop ATPase [Nocardioidaceae bacterium]